MTVVRLEIKTRQPLADGRKFDHVGCYEQLDGTAHFAGTRSENETRHFNGAAELRYQLAAISVERNEPLRGCRGAHLRAAASVKS